MKQVFLCSSSYEVLNLWKITRKKRLLALVLCFPYMYPFLFVVRPPKIYSILSINRFCFPQGGHDLNRFQIIFRVVWFSIFCYFWPSISSIYGFPVSHFIRDDPPDKFWVWCLRLSVSFISSLWRHNLERC